MARISPRRKSIWITPGETSDIHRRFGRARIAIIIIVIMIIIIIMTEERNTLSLQRGALRYFLPMRSILIVARDAQEQESPKEAECRCNGTM